MIMRKFQATMYFWNHTMANAKIKDAGIVTDIISEKDKEMTRDQNWVFGARVVGINNKKVQFFVKVKTVVNCCDLKICAHEKLIVDNIWMSKKTLKRNM